MSERTDSELVLADLGNEIQASICEYISTLPVARGRPTVAERDPQTATEVLMHLSTGATISKAAKATGVASSSVARLYSDFADHLGEWKKVGGQVSGGIYFDVTDKLSEAMQDMADARKEGDWKAVEAISKEVQALQKTGDVFNRHSLNARGESNHTIRVEKVATMEDVDRAAEDALKLIQEAEVVNE